MNDNTYKLMEQIEVVTRHYLRSDGGHQPHGQAIPADCIQCVE